MAYFLFPHLLPFVLSPFPSLNFKPYTWIKFCLRSTIQEITWQWKLEIQTDETA